MATFYQITNRISIECVSNADGFPGVVIYDDKTFRISSQQGDDAGSGPQSSVRPFQFPPFEDEETAMECDPPETKSDSQASNGAPPEVPMEVA